MEIDISVAWLRMEALSQLNESKELCDSTVIIGWGVFAGVYLLY